MRPDLPAGQHQHRYSRQTLVASQKVDEPPARHPLEVEVEHDEPGARLDEHLSRLHTCRDGDHPVTEVLENLAELGTALGEGIGNQDHQDQP
jgi:hypothetical protein